MTGPALARLRRLWLDVHLWIGVGLMVLLVPVAVTGAILVWHAEIDRALHADRYAVSGPEAALPAAAYAQAAQAAFGAEAKLTQVRLPAKAGDPVVAVGRLAGPPGPNGRPRTLNVWIDPPTGEVLSKGEVARTFTMVLHRVHGTLLIPKVGRKVVGWLGWAMFVSTATGLWLWWPRRGSPVQGLRWRRGASQLFNLHHAIGFWLCLPLAVLSLTGVYISFPQTSRALFGVAEAQAPRPPGPDPRFAPPLAEPRTSLDAALGAALLTYPGRVTSLSTPQAGAEPAWRIEIAGPEGRKTVQVADATGEPRLAPGRSGGGGPDPLSRLMRQIHDGVDTGPLWRTLITLAGLAPALLGVTGLVMWLRRSGRRQDLASS